jgi:hypothetical protein
LITAIKRPFEVVAPWVLALLKESMVLKQALTTAVARMVRGSKYRDIWKFTDLFEHIEKAPLRTSWR